MGTAPDVKPPLAMCPCSAACRGAEHPSPALQRRDHFGLRQAERPSGAPLGTNLLAWNTPGAPKPPGRARGPGDHATLELARAPEGDILQGPHRALRRLTLIQPQKNSKMQDKTPWYTQGLLIPIFKNSLLCSVPFKISHLWSIPWLFLVPFSGHPPGASARPNGMTHGLRTPAHSGSVFCSFSISAFSLLHT